MPDEITLPSGTPAYSAVPSDGRAPTRGVVVAPDIGGLRPLFADMCQALADDHGWAVCMPEPWPGRQDLSLEERLASVGGLDDSDVLGDLVAAADVTAAALPEGAPVGVMGFCMGGMYTFKAAGTGRFDRAAAFYGMIRIPEQWQGEGQGAPLDAVTSDGAAPVLAVIGTSDPWTPAADVDALEATGAEVVRYAGADHGFVHDPSRPAHRADYAADAWRRVITWLGG
ncbi:dienelactone hydrolase family protein [Actinospongicola halichondriae]|uniref:dienelactone hydrolase family protein n=1 Tax=Actinospongicola halichondriae TaxID=3236844 RepID=UPI003D5528B4